MDKKIGTVAIVLVSTIGIVGLLIQAPIAQDIDYHLFEDQRNIFHIPNFWNVISNLPFLIVGSMGLDSIFRTHKIRLITEIKTAYILFYLGVLLVAFGSSYYHLWPSNGTLVWDRLPMTIAFMALLSIIIGEFISSRLSKLFLWPLVTFGVFSIFYWRYTESISTGDLRLYILVQFLPILVIPIILLFFKSKFTSISGYWILLFAYVLAKVFEHFDIFIYNNIVFIISGHSIKHAVAALGILFLLKTYNTRVIIHTRRSS